MARVTEAHVEARKNQILDAAWGSFAKKGYHQTTMQDIASEAGISAGAIYRYYPSKEAVLQAITERNTLYYQELLADVQSESEGPMDVLEAVGHTMLAMFEDPAFETAARLEVELRSETLRNPVLLKSVRRQLEFWRTALTALMEDARSKGQLKKDIDIETLVILAMCSYEGMRQWSLIDPVMFRPREVFDLLLSMAGEDTPSLRRKKPAPARPRVPANGNGKRRG